MAHAVMSEQMRNRLNKVLRYRIADEVSLTAEYVDQAMVSEDLGVHNRHLFASYTPWGVACIEATFRDRMQIPAPWDSKDLIRRDILSNPHLHLNIKDRLLQTFERVDWVRWYDSYFCKCIREQVDPDFEKLREDIERNEYLLPEMRENLLFNLTLVRNEPKPQTPTAGLEHDPCNCDNQKRP